MKEDRNAASAANGGARPEDRRYLDPEAAAAWMTDAGIPTTTRQAKRLFAKAGFPRVLLSRKQYVRADKLLGYLDSLEAGE